MVAGQTGGTGLPAVRSVQEVFRFVNDPAPTPCLLLVGQIVLESPVEFSRATFLPVNIEIIEK